MIAGDEKCDYGNEFPEKPELHPHMSAPAVHDYLIQQGIDASEYTVFTITRHPLAMLWSYYNYFKPDVHYQYNYSPKYKFNQLSKFDSWLANGHVGIGLWRVFCPSYITGQNFTPLSLEAHAIDQNGVNLINKVFKLEALKECENWLRNYFGNNVNIKTTNQSEALSIPVVENEIMVKIRNEFPMESHLYDM